MISYAQNFEDVILRRALQDVESGFYVDIGAFDPTLHSVTAWFYRQGWSGVNVEPSPAYFERLKRLRPRDVNLPVCVGSISGTRPFAVLENDGLSSGKAGALEELRAYNRGNVSAISARAATLADIFTSAAGREVDFLKVDVEGLEEEVLKSAPFDSVRPRVIVVEAVAPLTQIPAHEAWEPWLLARDYEMVYFDGANRFYLRAEDGWRKPMFGSPPSIFDNFFMPPHAAEKDELLDRIFSRVETAVQRARFAVAERRWRDGRRS